MDLYIDNSCTYLANERPKAHFKLFLRVRVGQSDQ